MFNRDQALNIIIEAYRLCNERLNNTVCDAYLYGSFARGDYSADLDILITAKLNEDELRRYRRTISQINSELSLLYDIIF